MASTSERGTPHDRPLPDGPTAGGLPPTAPAALADLEDIRGLARTYAHEVWRRNVPGVVAVFTADARVDLGTVEPVEGRAAVTAAYEAALAGGEFLPFVHQHLVDLHGDTATGTCYVQVWGTVDGRKVLGGGYYEDRYRRTPDGWRISARTLTMLPFIPLGPPRPDDSKD